MKTAMPVLFFGLFTLCAGLRASSLQKYKADAGLNPVQKVVQMLKDMQAELEAEMTEDKEVYEKVTCWCQTNEKEKTAAIEMGTAKIEQLEAELKENAGKIAELKEKLKQTKDEKNKDWEALNEANGMRMKESQAFHEEETDLIGAIQSTKQAIVVLSKHNPDLIQLKKVVLKLRRVPMQLMSGTLSGIQQVRFKAFLQQAEKADSFLAIPGMQSYAPQSGQIFGILKQMQEDFEKNLKEIKETEQKAISEYEELKAAKEEEMAAGKKQLEEAEEELADTMERNAQAAEDLDDTQEQVKKDTIFLANLRKQCAAVDKEYEARVKARLLEMEAVQDTIGFLNSDEAHAMFEKALGGAAAFLQTRSVAVSRAAEQWTRNRVSKVLERAAASMNSPRLVLLATSVKLDAFAKVKEEIDKMIMELKKQQKDEIELRDWCIAELNKVNRTLEAKYDAQKDLTTKIADLESTAETLTKEIKAKTAAISDMQTEMKRSSEDRESENADYQQTVLEQQVTQQILEKALQRMKQVYALLQRRAHAHHHVETDTVLAETDEEQPGAPHIQTSGTDTDPGNGPARFNKMEKNAGGGKIVKMIQDIIDDSKQLEAEAIAAEQDSQTAYENFMKDSNDSITEYRKAITNMSEELAKTKEALVMAKEELTSLNGELEELHGTEADLHGECDYTLKNFEVRQAARSDEIDAMNEAKAILSGAK